jgi:glycosaminoglycan xylosylkinase
LGSPKRIALVIAMVALGCQRRPAPGEDAPASGERVVSPSATASAPPVLVASAPPSASVSAASAKPPPLPEPERPPAPPTALLAAPPAPDANENAGFRGPVAPSKDGAWLARLASAPIVEIVKNPGGATLTLRVRFADGERAVFKPDQSHSASNYRSEIAAYHVDRLLGFGRTAAVVGRTIGYGHLRDHLEHQVVDADYLARFTREVKSKNGRVAGAMIAWHSGRLSDASPPPDWRAGLRKKDAPPPEVAARLGEWTDLEVFDLLIDNTDRWSGGNVLALGQGGPLIFLDNAAGFASYRASRGESLLSRLEPICRFRRATRDALRAVGPDAPRRLGEALRRSLAKDPLAPVLGERHFAAIDERVAKLLTHIDACVSELGEDVVLLP